MMELEDSFGLETDDAKDWPAEEELGSSGAGAGTKHMWEESWDDVDTSDEFSVQLQYVQTLSPPSPKCCIH